VQWVADPLLLEQLRGAERLRGEPRSLRVARHPGRRLLPLALARRNDVLLRRVRTFYGAELLVALPDPVALSLYRYGSYDSATSAFLLHAVREGDCVLDAGAHVGYFTLLASRLAGAKGRVAAFEPNEFTRGLLRRNAVGSANIEVVGRAVGAGAASTTFRVPEFADIAYATLSDGDRIPGAAAQSWVAQPVELMSLDAYVAESGLTPSVIKLDVENNEEAALDGMQEILARDRPVLILELGDIATEPGRSRGLLDRILSLGYAAFEATPELAVRRHTPVESYGYLNLMFVPAERASA